MCEILFSVDVCIYSITFVLFWLSWKYLCFLIVTLIVIDFIGLVIISMYVKCFNIDVHIYSTLLILAFFVILILMYAFIVLVPFWLSSGFWCEAPRAYKFLRGIVLYKSYYYYYYCWELPQVSFLSRQNFCCDKHMFVTTNQVFCCDKSRLVVTNLFLSRQTHVHWNKYLSQQEFCRNKDILSQ